MHSLPCKQCGNYYSHKKGCSYWASTGMSEAIIMLEIKQRVLDDTYKLEDRLRTLEAKVKDYESGHRGACFTCEPVGELNKKLEAQLEVLTKCKCIFDIAGKLVYNECQGCKNRKLVEGGNV